MKTANRVCQSVVVAASDSFANNVIVLLIDNKSRKTFKRFLKKRFSNGFDRTRVGSLQRRGFKVRVLCFRDRKNIFSKEDEGVRLKKRKRAVSLVDNIDRG